jgi:hypothetical protein
MQHTQPFILRVVIYITVSCTYLDTENTFRIKIAGDVQKYNPGSRQLQVSTPLTLQMTKPDDIAGAKYPAGAFFNTRRARGSAQGDRTGTFYRRWAIRGAIGEAENLGEIKVAQEPCVAVAPSAGRLISCGYMKRFGK